MPRPRSSRRRQPRATPQPVVLDNLCNGRMLAWYAIQQFDQTGKFLSDVLNDVDRRHDLSPQERAQAVDLSAGVVRHRRSLDTLIEPLVTRPRGNVETELWTLLQMGAWQLVFARTPDHAAVDSIVELARTAGQDRWCGFVNGILRSVSRLLTEETTDLPSASALPIRAGQYRVLTENVFPEPAEDTVEFTGRAWSLPRAIARRWSSRMSPFELQRACFYSNEPPSTVLRINRLKATVGQVVSALEERGLTTSPGVNDWSLRVSGGGGGLRQWPGFDEGWWSVQDESAMGAAELLAPQPGERILDLCAAPGGKSAHLAELSGDAATIIACDVSEVRLRRVTQNSERLGLASVEPVLIERDGSDLPAGPFDAVLVDVPCSNTGVLSRRPEARWRFREADLEELVQLQTRLLLNAFDLVRPGGRIIYSTCSIEPEETTNLIASVTSAIAALNCVQQTLQLPGDPVDGAFRAHLQRDESAVG